MRKLYATIFVISIFVLIFLPQNAKAISQSVVISQIQLGNSISAKNEFVEIYNNSSETVEITNWCLSYLSSSLTPRQMACFTPSADNIHVFLPSHKTALAVSEEMLLQEPPVSGDIEFSYTLAGAAGYVRIIDNFGNEIDKVGWGITTPETNLVETAAAGNILSRKMIDENTYQDTDINSDDFQSAIPKMTYDYGFIYEVIDVCSNIIGIQSVIPTDYMMGDNNDCYPPPVDICTNLDGLQIIIPDGFLIDDVGECQFDSCQNIDGLRQLIPVNMDLDLAGNCVVRDECSNLSDIQSIIPDGYVRGDDNYCLLDLLPIKITEIMPNVTGLDAGNEFIEIFNPNDVDIDLANYVFYIGLDDEKYFNFPIDLYIAAGQYIALYNNDIKFTLLNTTSSVSLKSIDGTLIDETQIYNNPKEANSWAIINDLWQYTNRPTPSAENIESLIEPEVLADVDIVDVVAISNLKPCAANQYRSPETNRCRLLPISESVLAPCKDGQYRSEETNRCRSIVSDVVSLLPCGEGEERNPDTNRCRSITSAVLGANDLKPCDVGQERNPETNRCRNIVGNMPQVDYAPEQTAVESNNNMLWWSLGGVGSVAISYAVWEWRHEIVKIYKKVGRYLNRPK